MKLFINPLLESTGTEPTPAGLHLIQQPRKEKGVVLSILVGLLVSFVPIVLISIESVVFPRVSISSEENIPWWIIFPVLLICTLIHEFFHLVWHPQIGLSAQSSLNIWTQKLQFGVHYDGFMARSRWLVMRLSPLVGLTLLPTVFLLLAYFFNFNFFWQQFISLLILVNGLGSGGDFLASIIVYQQVPPKGEVGIWNGRACWR